MNLKWEVQHDGWVNGVWRKKGEIVFAPKAAMRFPELAGQVKEDKPPVEANETVVDETPSAPVESGKNGTGKRK
ncbi:hypothetical protein [Taklimakanibacter albus]|uniref:Uncharacterized protein n=1 Tax=Taklimakanibacter albus TaxID=2800327 RepID=A0ACC5R6L5_9HYPH|nr:hypothetical protein [Aestuariivirga sp. YIM B02566]MBK1868255.1 hypothetical protein [Aestuariivirga sp. YIM B02566]